MDIRNVANQSNVERAGDRARKAEPQRTVVIPTVARDPARISAAGPEPAPATESPPERASSRDRAPQRPPTPQGRGPVVVVTCRPASAPEPSCGVLGSFGRSCGSAGRATAAGGGAGCHGSSRSPEVA